MMKMEVALSQTEENYLKAIYALYAVQGKPVSTNSIAAKLETKPSSATDMIKKLADKELLNYVKYQGVSLTEQGKEIAVYVIRKHRLWEVFMVKHLDFSWDEVHEVAEQLEHVKSRKLIEKLDAFLEFPTHDPHGDPIPDKDGNIIDNREVLLSGLEPFAKGVVVGVKDTTSAFLKYLDKSNINLGAKIEIIQKEEFDNSMILKLNEENEMHVSHQIANNLFIKREK